jgi:serine/threonine-protein kinase
MLKFSTVESVSFGKYLLTEKLGEGGMAVVWRAKLLGPGGFQKEFCVKQIREELAASAQFIDLFVAEAKITVSLTHANIVPVYELGMVDGNYYLALELIDGPPLTSVVKRGPLDPHLAAYVIEQVLRGLDYAHRRGVVHRDLSAANVLVSRDGEVKIVDFGIAAQAEQRGVHGGSRGYMAPEQEAGGTADARSDLYAAGVILWELLAGKRYEAEPLPAGTPEPLVEIQKRATAESPDDRFPDAAAMLTALLRHLRDLSMAPAQPELSAYVRKHFPDVRTATGSRAQLADKHTGPRTVPVAGRDGTRQTGRNVTFATRIAEEPAKSKRRRWPLAVGGLTVAAAIGAASLIVAMPGKPSATPAPAPTAPTPAPAPTAPTPAPPTPTASAPRKVHLVVRSTPSGAEVRAGDRVLGLSPVEADVTLDGPLALKLRKRNFAPVDRTVAESAFEGTPPTAIVDERLAPLQKGELTLNALPWAHVTIDGEKRPDTPLRRVSLTAGPHQVRLQCPPTGRELKFTVVVEPDTEVVRLADLRGEPKLIDQ